MVSNSASADVDIGVGKGIISFQDNIISFENVPLVTPNGDLLVQQLSFEVRSGTNVLVCGPNGCGKSSLFRILGELWPSWGGKVVKPPRGKLFYVPQRPYMTLGSLRDQIIYPHTHEEMKRRGKTDNDLLSFLDIVQLRTLVQQRERGLDSIEDWIDVLSGGKFCLFLMLPSITTAFAAILGEKQRIAMARLFYHAPQFAIRKNHLSYETSAAVIILFYWQLTSVHQLFQLTSKAQCINIAEKQESLFSRFRIENRYGPITNSSFASTDEVTWTSLIFCVKYFFLFKGGYEFGKIDGSNEEFGS